MVRTLSLTLALLFCTIGMSAQRQIVLSEKLLDSLMSARVARSDLLTFEVLEVDLGKIADDKVYSSDFHFVNNTADTVSFVRIASSCRCLSYCVPMWIIPPGGKGRVTARYNPYRHMGPFEQRLELYAAEKEKPTAVLKVKGYVTPSGSDHLASEDENDN